MMRAKIDSLKKVLFDSPIKSLTVMTKAGEITVLPEHRPLITSLKPCAAKAIDMDGNEKFFEVKSGFLEVKRTKSDTYLTLLVD